MIVGDQVSLPAEGVQSYSEGAPGIVDVRLPRDGSRFVVVGLQPGNTTLLLIQNDGNQIQYRITVRGESEAPGAVEPRDNIRLDFYFVRVDESYSHQLGIAWPPFLGAASSDISVEYDMLEPGGGAFSNATATITGPPLPRLDLAQSDGWGRVVRQSAVITANDQEARYMSGGEINLPIRGGLGNDLKQIRFGSDFKVTPHYDSTTGRIELVIEGEVSELTDDRGTGAPGRTLAQFMSTVNLELGQAVMLGGVIAESNLATNTGLPGLNQIPILGILFGTQARRTEATQNVLFIVPTVVDVVSAGARERIREALGIYRDFGGDTDEVRLLPIPTGIPSVFEIRDQGGTLPSRPAGRAPAPAPTPARPSSSAATALDSPSGAPAASPNHGP